MKWNQHHLTIVRVSTGHESPQSYIDVIINCNRSPAVANLCLYQL